MRPVPAHGNLGAVQRFELHRVPVQRCIRTMRPLESLPTELGTLRTRWWRLVFLSTTPLAGTGRMQHTLITVLLLRTDTSFLTVRLGGIDCQTADSISQHGDSSTKNRCTQPRRVAGSHMTPLLFELGGPNQSMVAGTKRRALKG